MPTKRIVYTRHAEKTHNNNAPQFEGKRFDPSLTPNGFDEIEKSRNEIYNFLTEDHKFKYVICSPYLRCRLTMKGLRLDDNTQIIYHPDIREYLGNQNKRIKRILDQKWNNKSEFQVICENLTSDTFCFLKPEFNYAFENQEQLVERSIRAHEEFLNMINPGESILVVAHNIVIESIIEKCEHFITPNIPLECKIVDV